MILSYKGVTPDTKNAGFIAPSADILGDVKIGEDSTIWFNAVVRGDCAPIIIGSNTNVQDNATLHTDIGVPLVIGDSVTIGHNAVVHCAEVGDNTLIGMNATVLGRAKIGKNCIIGAGALVGEGKVIEDNSLVVGVPGKVIRKLTEDNEELLKLAAQHYVEDGHIYSEELNSNK